MSRIGNVHYRIDKATRKLILKQLIKSHGGESKLKGISRSKIYDIYKDHRSKEITAINLCKALNCEMWDITDGYIVGHNEDGSPKLAPITKESWARESFPGMGGPGTIPEGLEKIRDTLVRSLAVEMSDRTKLTSTEREFRCVREFQTADLKLGQSVTVAGILSRFAPLLLGKSKGLRDFHLQVREYAEQGKIKKSLLDSNLSISAGQIVRDYELFQSTSLGTVKLVGLFEGIARHHIPIVVMEKYWKQSLESILGRESNCRAAEVKGCAIKINGFAGMISSEDYSEKLKASMGITIWALVVDPDRGGRVSFKEPTPYLDGDIFVLAKEGRDAKFRTIICDLSDDEDVKKMRQDLSGKLKGLSIVAASHLGDITN